jgi:putative ABC transport system permease protein
MLTSVFKITRRKLWNHKASSFTKLFSLSVGIISLFYIGLYLGHEIGFENMHGKREKIFQANTSIISPTGNIDLALTAVPLGPYMKSVSPEISQFVRISKEYGSHAIKQGNALFSEAENILYADPSFFSLFDFAMLNGDKGTALEGPDRLIITRRTALKYFGRTDVVGEVLQYDGTPMTVTGVLDDIPSNTHLQFDFLLSMDTFMQDRPDNVNENWTWFPMQTYFLLRDPGGKARLQNLLQGIPQYDPANNPDDQYMLSLESLNELHFSEPKLGELAPKGSLPNLYLLFAVGVMILLLAVSNFINLTTADLSIEGRDVSVKRTLGASKKDILVQFLVESYVVTLLASAISVLGIAVTFRYFGQFVGGAPDLSILQSPLTWLAILALPLVLSLLGGVYPALKYARIPALYKPEIAGRQNRIFSTRTSLLVFQFAITSGLVIGSLMIYNQMHYIQNKSLGMDTRHKLVLDYGPNSGIGESYETLKEQLRQLPGVESATFSSHVPGQTPNGVATYLRDPDGTNHNGEIGLTLVDYDFVSDYGLEVIAGRDFRPGVADTTAALILNEAAVKAFGYSSPEDVIGASYEQWGGNGRVIGVVKDFNYLSLHDDVGLLSLKIWPSQFQKITLEVSENDLEGTLGSLEAKWTSLFPDIPFNYYFVDDNFQKQYTKDRQFATIMNLFTLISICIGVLGLVAYATFWCHRRRKEMSIKKVLGAKAIGLLWSLYRGFSVPVLIGFAFAVPVTYYLGNQWLEQFAYRFDFTWYFFVLPLMLLLLLVVMAVGAQTLQLVRTNPVEHLKEE